MTTRVRPTRALVALVGPLLVLASCGDAPSSSAQTTTHDDSVDVAAPASCAPVDGSGDTRRQLDEYPPMCLEEGVAYRAVIETTHGTVHVDLRPDLAPLTVNSFVQLARYHYFDDTTCHRAIKNFVVQCGDPTGSGRGGPGYEFADELDRIEQYRIGSVAMANAGPNTNGSQFFIITGDDGAMLPPLYTLFGQVVDDDLGVVAALDALGNADDGAPLEPIDIVEVTIEQI